MTKFDDLFSTMKFANDSEKLEFREMFDYYFGDIPANFYRNQFELASQYPGTNFEAWSKFLQHQPFDSWKSKQIAIIANTSTNVALAGGSLKDKESVNLLKARQEVLASENIENKPTIIVIPEDLFFKEVK